MKKTTKIILWISAALFVLLAVSFCLEYFVFRVPLFDRSGWERSQEGAARYLDYYGRPLKQWQTIGDGCYYFDPESGDMYTGWLDAQDGRYYLKEDGTMATGWVDVEESRYYFDGSGIMQIGWLETDGQRYYLNDDGCMQISWLDFEGNRYFLGENGVLSTGWVDMEDGRRYFDDNGVMQTGWLEQESGKYYLADTGLMQTGWVDTDDGRRFFDSFGLLQKNWVETEAGKQYLTDDGAYLTGWLETDTGRYYFNKDGIMQTGWVTDEKGRFYLYEDGTFATGFTEINGVKRYFTSNGEYVLLCNRWNPIPDDYQMNLVKIGNFKLDASCYDAMLEMMDAAKADGITVKLNSTYRSKATQQSMWETRRKKYMGQGMTLEEADEYIGRSVAVPGTSEHQTGLAADITGSQKLYDWLAENSWKYGFILRYPDNKIDITGIIFEPWHFRYVGKAFAKEVFDSGLCLEEYLTELEKAEG